MKIGSKNFSWFVFVSIAAILSIYRISNVEKNEISWDVLGYYIPLPATFVHDDPLLNSTSWLEEENKDKALSDTLYMISSNEEGEPMYFFLFGMAILYLPFFFLGHISAYFFDYSMNGFSPPYQYAMVIGGIVYTLIGLYFLRKILLKYFNESVTAIVLLITVFSTNYIHHLTLKNLETVNVLFMLVCIVMWFTILWHESHRLKHLIFIGLGITMISLVKPSEIIIVLLPLLWNVYSPTSFISKVKLLFKYKLHLLLVVLICFIVASPQIFYWYTKTGKFFYDSYKNPGVGLDIFSPYILEALFSYRKGWLVYTPIMIFYLLGFIFLFKKNRAIFFSIAIYFVVTFYIIASWTEWWYGAGFSNRPLITTYPLLAIGFGYFVCFIAKQSKAIKIVFGSVVLIFTFLNQFQWWQLKNYILDPYRTTKEYYWAVFLKTSVDQDDRKLLLVNRDFSGEMNFTNQENYKKAKIYTSSFQKDIGIEIQTDSTQNQFFRFLEDQEFGLTKLFKYNELTDKDHLWIVVNFDARSNDLINGNWPCFVFSVHRENGDYGYFAPEIELDTTSNDWKHFQFEYQTPPIRDRNDSLKIYFWKRGTSSFDIDNLTIDKFERKF